MLFPRFHEFEQEYRLHIAVPGVEAWIAQTPRRSSQELTNWQIWVKRPGDVARSAKSALRLEIESQLRSWLLRHYKRCLRTLDFNELRQIAEHIEQGTPRPPLSVRRGRAT